MRVDAERPNLAVTLLSRQIQTVEVLDDYGLKVRFFASLGEAFIRENDLTQAESSLNYARELWASVNALRWIRSLPSGAISQLSIMRASDAVAGAVLRLADLQRQRELHTLPKFSTPREQYPYGNRVDSVLTKQQREARRLYRQEVFESLRIYLSEVVSPWAARQLVAIASVRRSYEKVYLVPPFVAPRWRVSVAARIASMWGDYAESLRSVATESDKAVHVEHLERFYFGGDEPYVGPMATARAAFEACVAMSRRYQVLSEETLACEHWLAERYRQDYQQLDELFPIPRLRPTNSLAKAAPASVIN
jgi:hypothetical protein